MTGARAPSHHVLENLCPFFLRIFMLWIKWFFNAVMIIGMEFVLLMHSKIFKLLLKVCWNFVHNSILLYKFVKFVVNKRFWHYNFPFSGGLRVWKMRIEWQFCHPRRSRRGKSVTRFSIFWTRWLMFLCVYQVFVFIIVISNLG